MKKKEGIKDGVKVRFSPYLQRYTGQEWAESTGRNVGECLDNLDIQFPGIRQQLLDEEGNLLDYLDVYVNSESSYPEELAKPVNAGDEITILVLIGGG